jgi:2-polyprenyl-3-methyl-5-hydroxy-6-metoxy-1,4-benzoquinol methylase
VQPPSSPAAFYDQYAEAVFTQTVAIDASAVRRRFTDRLPSGASILDAGCGSGRDARAFADQGFQVAAFDASEAMVALARQYTGLPVRQAWFQDLTDRAAFHGIWASASLLHVPMREEVNVFQRLERALVPGGVLYASFRLGDGERLDGERLFRDHTRSSLGALLQAVPALRRLDVWENLGLRPWRGISWIHCLMCREVS